MRTLALELVDEAVAHGARRARAAAVLGLSVRTIERWRREQGGGEDRRAGPTTTPRNALTPAERRRVLEVVNSAPYRDLSPKQVVPALADAGRYIGSESTIYRLLRAGGLLAHRNRARPASRRRCVSGGTT